MSRRGPGQMVIDMAGAHRRVGRIIGFPHEAARRARRFVLDEAGSKQLDLFIDTCSDLILEAEEFAIPPYDPMYIELMSVGEVSESWNVSTLDRVGHVRVGLFLHGDSVVEIGCDEEGRIGLNPVCLYRHRPQAPLQLLLAETEPEEIQARSRYLFGTLPVPPKPATVERLVRSTRLMAHPDADFAEIRNLMLLATSGALLKTIAVLLLLNQPRPEILVDVGPRASMQGHRRVVYAKHQIIRLDLLGVRQMREIVKTGLRGSPRRHGVRGHFIHRRNDRSCEHDFEPLTLEPIKRWRCTKCGALRVWRSAFERGDATKGYVTHEYAVTADERHA